MTKVKLDCGCEFEEKDGELIFDYDLDSINFECQETWDLIGTGKTTGLFQIDSGLGQMMSKKLKPQNIHHLAALIAIMRPSCVSEDTKVCTYQYSRKNQSDRFKKVKIKDLWKQFHSKHPVYQNRIISYDETNHKLVDNKIKDIWSNGIKKVYSINFRKLLRDTSYKGKNYKLECTENHKLFVYRKGWIELKNIEKGDRFLVLSHGEGKDKLKQRKLFKGQKIYRSVCFNNYDYECLFCDWSKGSLDVNHIDGDRKANNEINNLCFLCPNHHRMYTEGSISAKEIITERKNYILPQNEKLFWAEYIDYKYIGEKEVFDIETEGPHHNFIAGEIIVHNCLKGVLEDGKSIADHFIDRKNGAEPATSQYPVLEPILKSTYNLMIYQEQAIKIGQEIAGMSLQDSDHYIRYGIGKKKADIIAAAEKVFLEGCKKVGKAQEKEALAIWEWIKSAQRYQFNSAHSYSYAMISYLTAVPKVHARKRFYKSWLNHSGDKIKPFGEIKNLVVDARTVGIDVRNPDIRVKNSDFIIKDGRIYFGLGHIKGVGESSIKALLSLVDSFDLNKLSWGELLFKVFLEANKTIVKHTIAVGCYDYLKLSREKMLFDHDIILKLTKKEVAWIINNIELEKFDNLLDILRKILSEKTGKGKGISNKNRENIIKGLELTVVNEPYHVKSNSIRRISTLESSYLGVPLSCHKIDEIDKDVADSTIEEYQQGKTGIMKLLVEVMEVKEITPKKSGKPMAFVSAEDATGSLTGIVCFNDLWEEKKEVLFEGNTILLVAKKSDDRDSLIILDCKDV